MASTCWDAIVDGSEGRSDSDRDSLLVEDRCLRSDDGVLKADGRPECRG